MSMAVGAATGGGKGTSMSVGAGVGGTAGAGAGAGGKRTSGRVRMISTAMRVVDAEVRNEETLRRLKQLDSDPYMEELVAAYAGVGGSGGADEAYEVSDDEEMTPQERLAAKRKRNALKAQMKANAPKGSKKKQQSGAAKLSKWVTRKFKTLERIVEEQGYENILLRKAGESGGAGAGGDGGHGKGDPSGDDGGDDEEEEDDDDDGDDDYGSTGRGRGKGKGKGRKTRKRAGKDGTGAKGQGKEVSSSGAPSSSAPATSASVNYLSIAAAPSAYPRRHFCAVCGYLGSYACTRCGSRYCSTACHGTHKESMCMKFGYQ